jgi:hypothetical protein
MRFTTTFVLAMILSLGLVGSALAQGTGRSLDIQPGARQNGLGAAGVALGDDPTGATWWNPAGLGFATKSAAEVSYAQLVPGLATDVSYNYATYLTPVQGWGAIGFGLVFLSYGTSEETDLNGHVNGTFNSYEVSPAAYWGTKVLPELAVGASLKFIRIQLAPKSLSGVGSTIGFDLGALYKIPAARLRLGMNVQNLGPSVAFLNDDNKSPLSRNLKMGAAWEASKSGQIGFLVVGDFNQSLVTPHFRTYNGGVELKYSTLICGRVGYYDDPLGQIGGLTYGIGFSVSSLAIDFGSIPQAKDSGLPNVSKITLGYRF